MFGNILGRITSPHLIYMIPAILIALTVHEFFHAYVSSRLGDPTPRYQGRVSLNPVNHIDPVGLIALILLGFGWGKPVQIDDRYYSNRKTGRVLVSLAGPLSNLGVAIIGAMLFHLLWNFVPFWMLMFLWYVVLYNVYLGIFNLLPIPPLDGSKLLFEALPSRYRYEYYYTIQRYFPIVIIILLSTNIVGRILLPIAGLVFRLLQLPFGI